MLQAPYPVKDNYSFERQESDGEHSTLALSQFVSAVRRQSLLLIGCCLGGLLLGAGYLAVAVPRYTATANIMIDTRQVRALRDVSMLSDSPGGVDAPELESQVEILRSPKIVLAVISALNLTEDHAFMNPPRNPIRAFVSGIFNIFGKKSSEPEKLAESTQASSQGSDPETALQLKASKILERGIHVSRVGRSFLLQVDYTGPDPARAAEITNAYVDAYLSEQLNSRIEATRRARSWLQQRTEELRQMAVESDRAAQKFKADNNLLAAKGALITEQRLVETSTQLVTYRAAVSEAQAK
jgi:polysaccharide biosynthesis transport protein